MRKDVSALSRLAEASPPEPLLLVVPLGCVVPEPLLEEPESRGREVVLDSRVLSRVLSRERVVDSVVERPEVDLLSWQSCCR